VARMFTNSVVLGVLVVLGDYVARMFTNSVVLGVLGDYMARMFTNSVEAHFGLNFGLNPTPI